jgi:predicted nucleic acid-binding protein
VSRFVLDATVTMAWCFAEEATDSTEGVLSRLSSLTDSAIVPALWLYETANVAALAVRRGRITEDKARAFLESLVDLPIQIENLTSVQLFGPIRALAGLHNLTVYDASYLDLAISQNLPIATTDQALTKAAHAVGVALAEV